MAHSGVLNTFEWQRGSKLCRGQEKLSPSLSPLSMGLNVATISAN